MPDIKRVSLSEHAMKQAEYERTTWCVTPDAGTPYEALFQPNYWAHNARRLKLWDLVEVRYFSDDQCYWALLLVEGKGDLWAKVTELWKKELGKVEPGKAGLLDDFEVKYKGPAVRWCVIHKPSGRRVHEKSQTEEQATGWLREHKKALAA